MLCVGLQEAGPDTHFARRCPLCTHAGTSGLSGRVRVRLSSCSCCLCSLLYFGLDGDKGRAHFKQGQEPRCQNERNPGQTAQVALAPGKNTHFPGETGQREELQTKQQRGEQRIRDLAGRRAPSRSALSVAAATLSNTKSSTPTFYLPQARAHSEPLLGAPRPSGVWDRKRNRQSEPSAAPTAARESLRGV